MTAIQRSRLDWITEGEIGIVEPFQIIAPDGTLKGELPFDDKFLLSLHRELVFSRAFDERAINLSSVREIGTYAPHSGQEATQIGMIRALRPTDWFVPMYRDNAAMIAKGLPPEMLLEYWAGDERGLRIPRDIRMLPFGIPVASQLLHAVGLAKSTKLGRSTDVVLTTTGDGGTSKGDFHEALNFAGVYSLPLIVGVENNQYAISLPRSDQTRSKTIAQKAVAYGAYGLLVDGNDVAAVYYSTAQAAEKAREGQPVLLEYFTYRLSYHTTAELVSHKLQPEEELAHWRERDPIARVERYIKRKKLLTDDEIKRVYDDARARVKEAVERFRSNEKPDPLDIFRYMYSMPTPELLEEAEERFGELARALGSPPAEYAESLPEGETKELNIRNSVNLALKQEMEREQKIVVFGEDVARNGGVFQVTRGLLDEFGERVFDTPLAEGAIAGMFLGLSVGGFIPVAEFQFDGFSFPAFDQIFNHIARFRNRTRGAYSVRGVVRFPYGAVHSLEHHSDSPESYYVHTPGLKVVVPSNPVDAKGLLISALRSQDPVVFMEPKRLYDSPRVQVPLAEYTTPIGKARVIRSGDDVTVVGYGAMTAVALEGAKNYSADVIDLRTLSPLDTRTIVESVEKTGRLVVVHEAPRTLGMGAEIVARVCDKAILSLKAPIKRVTGYDIVDPLARLEDYNIPGPERVAKAISQVLSY